MTESDAKNHTARHIIASLSLLFLSVCFFFLSHPNFLFTNGLPFFAWVAYIPLFILADTLSLKESILCGFIYGISCYSLYCSWLAAFSPVGMVAACLLYGPLLAIVCALLWIANNFLKKIGWAVQWIIFCLYEYVKTLGFLGFSYGVTGYTQWRIEPLVSCASIAGVYGISALVVFCSAWMSHFVLLLRSMIAKNNVTMTEVVKQNKKFFASGIVWLIIVAFAFMYGSFSAASDEGKIKENGMTVHVALIQNNSDPWKSGVESYRKDIASLEKLTDDALEKNPDTEIVVWPETAVVPPVMMYYENTSDKARHELIMQLLSYMQSRKCVFVIGNDNAVDDAQIDVLPKHDDSRQDFNSALVFGGTDDETFIPPNPRVYSKMHLVPFTEYFPWPEQFPHIYKLLLDGDTHLWSPGKDAVVFDAVKNGESDTTERKKNVIKFSTPVCFEDTFPSVARLMNKRGARLFINISNDAWSHSTACQNQHLSMAVFRAAENRIPEVRSTSSGVTCIIDRNGKIVSQIPQFEKSYLCGALFLEGEGNQTLYSKTGDVLPVLMIVILAACFIYWIKTRK